MSKDALELIKRGIDEFIGEEELVKKMIDKDV